MFVNICVCRDLKIWNLFYYSKYIQYASNPCVYSPSFFSLLSFCHSYIISLLAFFSHLILSILSWEFFNLYTPILLIFPFFYLNLYSDMVFIFYQTWARGVRRIHLDGNTVPFTYQQNDIGKLYNFSNSQFLPLLTRGNITYRTSLFYRWRICLSWFYKGFK